MKLLTCGFEVKALDGKTGEIEGYASTFNNIDQGGDKVMPGAFKKTIRDQKGKFPILDSHDPTKQIGWNLEAIEDEKGLFVKGQLLINDIPEARKAYAIMQKALEIKAKAGLSIGYMPVKWEMDEDEEKMRYRKLKEVKLYEYSMVAFPMNIEATATAVKEFDQFMKAMEGNELDQVNNFIAIMKKEGFNELKIKSALEAAAAEIDKPDEVDLTHLFESGIKLLKI